MTDHVKRDWTLEEVGVLVNYLADQGESVGYIVDAVEKPWNYTDEYLKAVGMPEDAEVVTLTVVEDDPCCLMYRETYFQDHERDCPARLRHELCSCSPKTADGVHAYGCPLASERDL